MNEVTSIILALMIEIYFSEFSSGDALATWSGGLVLQAAELSHFHHTSMRRDEKLSMDMQCTDTWKLFKS